MADQPDYGFTNGPAVVTTPAPPEGNGMAVAALVMGIVALVLFWLPLVNWIVSLLGVIFGGVGLGKSKRNGKGKGFAMAGLIMGILGLIVGTAFVIYLWQEAKHGHFRHL